ncbi:MAG: type II toxin-antitoxin system Phd/YefM family antitoxin [Promethearchaeota archaeon]
MTQISVNEMKRDLLSFLHRVESGETLVIVKTGKPVAEIKPLSLDSPPKKSRPFGLCAGEFIVPDDFNEPLPENIIDFIAVGTSPKSLIA